MSDSDVEYATEQEVRDFLSILCDRPGDDATHTRHEVAAQLAIERATERGCDLTTIESLQELASETYLDFCALNELASATRRGEPLQRAKYLKFMGALWRTMPDENFQLGSHAAEVFPEQFARTIEERNFKQPRPDTPGLYDSLGLIDPARTRRSQSSALSQGVPLRRNRNGRRAKNLHNN